MERNKKISILTSLAIAFGSALSTLVEPNWQTPFLIAWIVVCLIVQVKLIW